jgi:hypothetical protein
MRFYEIKPILKREGEIFPSPIAYGFTSLGSAALPQGESCN